MIKEYGLENTLAGHYLHCSNLSTLRDRLHKWIELAGFKAIGCMP